MAMDIRDIWQIYQIPKYIKINVCYKSDPEQHIVKILVQSRANSLCLSHSNKSWHWADLAELWYISKPNLVNCTIARSTPLGQFNLFSTDFHTKKYFLSKWQIDRLLHIIPGQTLDKENIHRSFITRI